MRDDTRLKLIIGISVIGLLVAFYQTYEHYFLTSAVCDISKTLSCSVVTGSRFGEFPPSSGIATAAWGVLWWLSVIALAAGILRGARWFKHQVFYLFADIVFGIGFVVYLLVVELYILPQETGRVVICPFCTVQHVLIAALIPLTYMGLERPITAYIEDIFYREVER